jgi:putative AdoMet-dependent methyltransferase
MLPDDPFPPSDFDAWAETYDQSIREYSVFPFAGYEKVLDTVVSQAAPRPGISVLDLGTGTANLALRFDQLGCELTCTDFSKLMLEKARAKLPKAHFVLHDLRAEWPKELDRRFDRIVSAYVFHHFELEQKARLCRELTTRHLLPSGKLVIADLSFPSQATLDIFKQTIANWEDEFYWLADEAQVAFAKVGLGVEYLQVSPCAGVYIMQNELA